MQTVDHCSRAEGVGVAYHPFLHDTLLQCSGLFDFVELPLDLYMDAARSALLDPGQRRLQQIVAARPCVWRGTALSLGTVGPDDKTTFPPSVIRRIRTLLELAGSEYYTDTIGFRTESFGPMLAMTFAPDAARWIVARQAAACDALGLPVRLSLPSSDCAVPATGSDCVAFLACIASHGGTDFVLDAADFGGSLERELAERLPRGHVAALSISSAGAPGWETLEAVAKHIPTHSVILRRDRQLFPLDTIAPDITRAARLIADAAPRTPTVTATASAPDVSALALLRDYQSAPAADEAAQHGRKAAAEVWQNWRTQVDDMYKAQQIMALMARGTGPRASWSP